MRRLITPALLLLSLACANASSAQTPGSAPGGPSLTLDEAVAQALEKNFAIQVQRYATDSAEAAVDIAEADYRPTLSVTASTGVTQQAAASSTLDGTTAVGPRNDRTTVRLSAAQRVVTGATVTVGSNLLRNETNSRNALLNPAFNSDVSLSVRQPLLRGFGLEYNRASIKRARLGVERAGHDFRGAVLDVIRNVETAYYELAFARQQLELRQFSLSVAEELLTENEAKRQTGVATDLEVLQARVGVANANREVLLAQQTVFDREDQLKSLLNDTNYDAGVGTIILSPLDESAVSFALSYKLALDNRPDYASALAGIEQFRIDERNARSNRRPTLDVGVAVGYNSIAGSADDALADVWKGDGYSWQTDVQLSVPWGFKADKARLVQAHANLARSQTQLAQLDQNIAVQVRAAVRSVETNRESLRISSLATQLSQQQFDLEKARFDAGLSTFRRVQEAQEDLDNAQVNELRAAVTLRNARADLNRLEGSSLNTYQLELDSE